MSSIVYPNKAGTESGMILLATLGSPVTAAADTTEQTLFTYTLPGGAMGPNGIIEINCVITVNNNANGKTIRVKFGSTTLHTMALASKLSGGFDRRIYNAGDQAVQRMAASTLFHEAGTSGVGVTSATEDTSSNVVIAVTAQKSTAGDTITFQGGMIRLIK